MSCIMAGRRGTLTRTIILQTLKQHPQLIKGKQIHTLTSTTQQAPFHHRPQNLEHAQQRPVYSQPADVRIEPQQRHLLHKFLLPTQPSVYLSQTLYPIGGFPQKLIVAFHITVHYGIVHVADRDTFLLQPVAEQCIFMSISADAFIEWDGLHHPSMHNKVVSHKRSVRMLASLTGIVALAPHPVHIPQVMLTVVTLAVIHSPPAKHTLNRFMLNSINVFRQKALPHYRVAIQKQQIVILGISQKQVAEKLDVSPSIVSGYETGERTPSTENLLSLSYLYNVSTDYLLGRQAADPHSLLDISKLTNKQKAAVTNLIESIIKS